MCFNFIAYCFAECVYQIEEGVFLGEVGLVGFDLFQVLLLILVLLFCCCCFEVGFLRVALAALEFTL